MCRAWMMDHADLFSLSLSSELGIQYHVPKGSCQRVRETFVVTLDL